VSATAASGVATRKVKLSLHQVVQIDRVEVVTVVADRESLARVEDEVVAALGSPRRRPDAGRLHERSADRLAQVVEQ